METVREPNQKRSWRGYFLLATVALTCPCHIPLALAILGGTALAAFLEQHLALAVISLTFVFLFALVAGLKLIGRERSRKCTVNVSEVGRFSST